MRIIEVCTKRGDTLYGVSYGEKYKDVCVIITNGTGGNIFENKFLQIVGEECEKNKICFIFAHNSGAFQIIDTPSKNKNRSGVTFELFDNSVEDIDAYVNWAKDNGYKKIILGGHSYGTNKLVYYLYKTKNTLVNKYILISPTDVEEYSEGERESIAEIMPIALHYKQNGKLDEIIPILFDKCYFYTARAFLDYIENVHHDNIPIYHDEKNFYQIKSIGINGLFIMGQNDSFAKRNAEKHLNILYRNSGNKNNVIKVIYDTSHTFRGKEKELAKEIIKFVQN